MAKGTDLEMTTATLDKLCELHDLRKHDSLFLAVGDKTVILGDTDLNELRGKSKSEKTVTSRGWRRYVPFLKSNDKKTTESVEAKDIECTEGLNRCNQKNSQKEAYLHQRRKHTSLSLPTLLPCYSR